MSKLRKYWFPAKQYGWGWGFPATWQGWAVLVGYLLLLVAGFPLIALKVNVIFYVVYVDILSTILVIICWCTGEPTRWRWGKRDDEHL